MPCKGPTPGPYSLPGLIGCDQRDYTKSRAPCYSIGIRTQPLAGTQSPGPYKVENCTNHGKYPYKGWTMGLPEGPKTRETRPGPTDYIPKVNKYTPAFSMGLKKMTQYETTGPGPGAYFPKYNKAGGFSMTGRPRVKDVMEPGPYAPCRTDTYKAKAPAFSMGLTDKVNRYITPSPGPIYYPKRPCCHNVCSYAYTFGLRHSECAPPMITYDDSC